jgi:hypothetical protein
VALRAVLILVALILGFACFVIAVFRADARGPLIPAGLALWILTAILEVLPK